jgi:hypothetical protein
VNARLANGRHAGPGRYQHARLGTNQHQLGAPASQTRAPERGIVTNEGGGFNPTLSLGGAAGFCGAERPRLGEVA